MEDKQNIQVTFAPGQMVWQVITPSSFCSSVEEGQYRIAPYFVLESRVESVRFDPEGRPDYEFDNGFDASMVCATTYATLDHVSDRIYANRGDAVLELMRILVQETPAVGVSAKKVRCVTRDEYVSHRGRLREGIAKMVQQRVDWGG